MKRYFITLGVLIALAIAVWNVPTGHSELQHRNAVANPYFPAKAYDSGADFFAFNRCRMLILVGGKKFTFAGDEQNDQCTFANAGDAIKAMAFVRGSVSGQ